MIWIQIGKLRPTTEPCDCNFWLWIYSMTLLGGKFGRIQLTYLLATLSDLFIAIFCQPVSQVLYWFGFYVIIMLWMGYGLVAINVLNCFSASHCVKEICLISKGVVEDRITKWINFSWVCFSQSFPVEDVIVYARSRGGNCGPYPLICPNSSRLSRFRVSLLIKWAENGIEKV